MTNPFDPKSDNNSNGGFGSGNGGDLPRYETTSHPEDQEGFGTSANPAFGAHSSSAGDQYAGYGAANAGQPGYAGAGYSTDSSYAGPGPGAGPAYTGPVSAMEAIKWGFKAALGNAVVWLVGAVVYFLVMFVPQFAVGFAVSDNEEAMGVASQGMSWLTGILSLFVWIVVYRLAYREIDKPSPSWGDLFQGVRWVPPLVVNIVLGVLGTIVFAAVVVGLVVVGVGGGSSINWENPTDAEMGKIMGIIGAIFGILVLVLLAWLFIQPFFTLMPWLAADTSSIGESFSKGLSLGKENYGHILLFLVLQGLLYAASMLTLGLALIIIGPAMALATAHLCRQCQGRYAPAA